jgi:ABC-2 type transport system permease protein
VAAAAWDRGQTWRTNLRGIGGRAYPRVSGIVRDRSWLFFETLLPLLATASFVYVYRALGAPQQYVGFVVLGGAMTAFWLNVMWMMAAQLYWEKDSGNLEL